MRFLKLTSGKGGQPVYIDATDVNTVEPSPSVGGTFVSSKGRITFVAETPEQIFELIHTATGEPVTWYAAMQDADAVDTAIDEAYQRGKRDAEQGFGTIRDALDRATKSGYDRGYEQGRKDAIAEIAASLKGFS